MVQYAELSYGANLRGDEPASPIEDLCGSRTPLCTYSGSAKVRILLCIACFVMPLYVLAQKHPPESLHAEVSADRKESIERTDRLNARSEGLIETGDYDQALNIAAEAYNLAQRLDYYRGEFNAQMHMAKAFAEQGKSEKAITANHLIITRAIIMKHPAYSARARIQLADVLTKISSYAQALDQLDTAITISSDIPDKSILQDAYSNKGNVHTLKAEYTDAMKYYLTALGISEEIGNSEGVMTAYHNMGTVAWHQLKYSDAVRYFRKALIYARELNDKRRIANALNNLGNVHFIHFRFDSAHYYYNEALILRQEVNDKYAMAVSYNNLGVIYKHTNRPEQALETYTKAMDMQRQLNDLRGLTASYLNIGSIQGVMGNYEAAVDSTLKGIKLAREIGIKEHIKTGYVILTEIYQSMQDYQSALANFVEYSLVKDSLLNEETRQQIEVLKVQYETEKKDRENIELRLENERQTNLGTLLSKQKEIAELNLRNEESNRLIAEGIIRQREDSIEYLQSQKAIQQTLTHQEQELREAEQLLYEKALAQKNLLLLALSGAALLIGIIIYLAYRVRRRRFQQNLREVEEKALRAQLKPHFVFNAVASIQSFIHGRPELADQYLTKFSHFTQEVLQNSEKQSIPLSDELSMLRKYMDLQNLRLKHPFDYKISIDEGLDPEEVMVPPAIFQPLVENSINHNFSGKPGSGRIHIRVFRDGGLLKCIVEDTCEGSRQTLTVDQPSRAPDRKSFGLQIVRERLTLWAKKKVTGSFLELEPHEHGMRVVIGIPQ